MMKKNVLVAVVLSVVLLVFGCGSDSQPQPGNPGQNLIVPGNQGGNQANGNQNNNSGKGEDAKKGSGKKVEVVNTPPVATPPQPQSPPSQTIARPPISVTMHTPHGSSCGPECFPPLSPHPTTQTPASSSGSCCHTHGSSQSHSHSHSHASGTQGTGPTHTYHPTPGSGSSTQQPVQTTQPVVSPHYHATNQNQIVGPSAQSEFPVEWASKCKIVHEKMHRMHHALPDWQATSRQRTIRLLSPRELVLIEHYYVDKKCKGENLAYTLVRYTDFLDPRVGQELADDSVEETDQIDLNLESGHIYLYGTRKGLIAGKHLAQEMIDHLGHSGNGEINFMLDEMNLAPNLAQANIDTCDDLITAFNSGTVAYANGQTKSIRIQERTAYRVSNCRWFLPYFDILKKEDNEIQLGDVYWSRAKTESVRLKHSRADTAAKSSSANAKREQNRPTRLDSSSEDVFRLVD